MERVLAICLLLISLQAVSASEPDWSHLKQPDPGRLVLSIYADIYGFEACPFSEAELNKRIEMEFLKVRIAPTDDSKHALVIHIKCLKASDISKDGVGEVVFASIRFATLMRKGVTVLYSFPEYGHRWVFNKPDEGERKQSALDYLSQRTERALEDFLKANGKKP